jgi:hypothetical protein
MIKKKIKFSMVYETKTPQEFSEILGEELAKLIIKNNIRLDTLMKTKTAKEIPAIHG